MPMFFAASLSSSSLWVLAVKFATNKKFKILKNMEVVTLHKIYGFGQ